MSMGRDFYGRPLGFLCFRDDLARYRGLAHLPTASTHYKDHFNRFFNSATSARSSVTFDRFASCWRYAFKGLAGVPQTVCPDRIIFDVRTPLPDPKIALDSMRALSPMP